MHIREYYPALPNLKNILMGKWYLIQNQPSICEKYLQGATPHFISQMKIPTRHSSKSNLFANCRSHAGPWTPINSCDGPLSFAEASEALCLPNRNRTRGANGLCVEFYAHFWHKLGETSVAVLNLRITNGDLPKSMKASHSYKGW